MNYLLLEKRRGSDELTVDSFVALTICKYLEAECEIRIRLIESDTCTSAIAVNITNISSELDIFDENNEEKIMKLPMLKINNGSYNIIGLCSVLRAICRLTQSSTTKGSVASKLLGFKENCLLSASTTSLWVNFCEQEIIACLERLLADSIDSPITFPLEMLKLETEFKNPVRMHNVFKAVREAKKDQSIESKSAFTADIEHKYCHGNEANLSDFILYVIFKLIFLTIATNETDFETNIPHVLKWHRNMSEEFPLLNDIVTSLSNVSQKYVSFKDELPVVEANGKYFSLFKRQLIGHKMKKCKSLTNQNEIDLILSKLASLSVDMESMPGSSNDNNVDDKVVEELLSSGEFPEERLDRKKSQLKSFVSEVIGIAQDGDVIVDFCSGTGHVGLLIAMLRPKCRVIILENKEESIKRASIKAKKLQLLNVTYYQCNLEYFNEKFTIGVSLHACGIATDLVLDKCYKMNANFISSPCCYGKIQDLGNNLPQSQRFRDILNANDLIKISHCADQTHDEKNVKHINLDKARQGYYCMDIIDTDRSLRAQELGYSVKLTRLYPEDCTLKNRLLIGTYPRKIEEATPNPIIQTRQSRVMHFEDKTKAFKQVVGKDQLAKLKEQKLPPTQYVNHPRRKQHPQNMAMRKNLQMNNGKRVRITAVHYDGDSTRLEEMRHHSFKGNGKVMLNKNEYLHWKPAEWVLSHGMDKYFRMDSTGTLTVNDHGLFLIYAQVYYSDTHDLNGYEILHNDHELYQCTTMTHMNMTKDRTNSCYTSGLIHLRNGDKIKLRDVGNHRNVLLQKSKSYFGLIKINLTPATHSNDNTDVERFDQIK